MARRKTLPPRVVTSPAPASGVLIALILASVLFLSSLTPRVRGARTGRFSRWGTRKRAPSHAPATSPISVPGPESIPGFGTSAPSRSPASDLPGQGIVLGGGAEGSFRGSDAHGAEGLPPGRRLEGASICRSGRPQSGNGRFMPQEDIGASGRWPGGPQTADGRVSEARSCHGETPGALFLAQKLLEAYTVSRKNDNVGK